MTPNSPRTQGEIHTDPFECCHRLTKRTEYQSEDQKRIKSIKGCKAEFVGTSIRKTFGFSPAWLSLILVVLAMLIEQTASQTLHFYLQKTDELTSASQIVSVIGSQASGATYQVGVNQISNNNAGVCSLTFYKPSFTNGSTTASSPYTAYCPYSFISLIQPGYTTAGYLVTINRQTNKLVYVQGNSNTGPFKVRVATESAGAYTGAYTESGSISPSAAIEFLLDMEGTSKVYLLVRNSGSLGRIRGYVTDVGGATPTTPTLAFQTNAGDGMDSMLSASMNIDNKLMVFNGAVTTLVGSAYIVNTSFFLYDVFTAPATPTFKAGYYDLSWAPGLILFDNLNGQDYIYTMLANIADQNNPLTFLAVNKISALIAAQSGTTLQTGDIWTGALGSKTDLNGLLYSVLLNAGSFQYVMVFSAASDSAVQLFPKNFATFGQNPIYVRMPPVANLVSATYAYGFFRYVGTENYNLYYQSTYYTDPLYKAPMVSCPAGTPYFNIVDYSCTDGSVVPAGFRKDTTYYEIEPCKIANCDSCPSFSTFCSVCKTGYTLYANSCPLCNAAPRCVTCDTDNHCLTCQTGYLPDASGQCTVCDAANGYSWNAGLSRCEVACTVNHCTTCQATDGSQCTTCNTGYLGSTCATCDAGNGYVASGGLCVLQCPTVNHCNICATTTTCQTCSTGYTGSTCTSCATDYAMVSGSCVLQCPTVNHCTVCATPTTCQTCDTGYTGSTCTSCATNYAMNSGVCVLQCPSVSHCTTCATPTTCSVCQTGYSGALCDTCTANYAKIGSDCVLQCPTVNNCNVCATTTTCQTCSTGYTGSTCTSCAADYAMVSGSCVLQCPTVNHCTVCATPTTCQTCDTGYTGSTCTSCATNYAMNSGVCVLQCPSVSHCTTCATPTTCSVCQTGYSGALCDTCTANYAKIGSNCVLQCPTVPQCDVCATTTTCTTCKPGYLGTLCDTCDAANGYVLQSGNCVLTCPSVSNCDICQTQTTCQTCSTGYSGTTCTSCATNYAMNSGVCVLQCPSVSHCTTCATPTTCSVCQTGYSGALCDTCTANYAKIGSNCVLQCPTVPQCDVCATTTTCTTCKPGYLGTLCDTCDAANGYVLQSGNCVLTCPSITNCDVCQTQTSCKTCATGYGLVGVGCVMQCPTVSHCDVCATFTSCQTCSTGYTGAQCDTCAANYAMIGSSCVLQCPSITKCAVCATPTSCQTCQTGYAGPNCDRCAVGYLADPNNAHTCIACKIDGCGQCSSPNVCSQCQGTMIPIKAGTACIELADACKSSVQKCQTCSSEKLCKECQSGYYLSNDKAICKVKSCSVDFCLECETEATCKTCQTGFKLENAGKLCNLLSLASEDEIYNVFNTETQSGFVQLNRPAADFDVNVFTFYLKDSINGSTFKCPHCKAEPHGEFSKALQFKVQTDVEMLSASLHATYPASSVKSQPRKLQSSESEGVLIVHNLRLPGTGANHDDMTYSAFTAFNAIRFIGTIVLGFFNSIHAFWPTYQFSWLQIWAVLPGKFLSYPDRFLNWHYKWYLLVVNFGDPFKTFRDWNLDGYKCVAYDTYPFSKLGCSFVDNFGQNFVIIFCVLAFCLASLAFFYFFNKRITQKSLIDSKYSGVSINREFRNQIIKNNGLGMTYFMKFMNSIQPSLMFFSLLQFNTYLNSPNMGVSVFFSVVFFVFYLVIAILSAYLSKRMSSFMKDRKTKLKTLDELAFAEGGTLNILSFQYSGYLVGPTFRHLLLPLVEYARILFNCIFLVALKKSPQAALALILVVEAARTAYIVSLHRLRLSLVYAIMDYVVSGLYLLYILLKLGANGSSDEESSQRGVGWVMAAIYAVVWAQVIVDIGLDGWMTKRGLVQQREELKKTLASREGTNPAEEHIKTMEKDGGIVQVLDEYGNPSSPSKLIVIDDNQPFGEDSSPNTISKSPDPKWSSLPPIRLSKIGTLKPKLGESVESLDKADIVTIFADKQRSIAGHSKGSVNQFNKEKNLCSNR
jgi:hypothetical protein